MDEHTFLFADLAGFTALTEAHGDEEAAELIAAFCDAVAALLEHHGAEQVKSIGDAVMLRVPDAREAVRLGLRIVGEVGARHEFPSVRVGMHTGPAVERDGDWFGASVNLAARVSAAASGGEVLLTESTRERLDPGDEFELRARGEQRFRNVTRPVTLYEVVAAGRRESDLPIDPVCRMRVEPERASGTLRHRGQTFHFCSLRCAAAFAADPDVFTEAVPSHG